MARPSPIKVGIAWGLYDFANSGYYIVYSVLLFPLYLATQALPSDQWFEAKWGMAQAAAVAIAVGLGIILGSRLDAIGIRKVARITTVAPAVASLLLPLLIAFKVDGNLLIVCYCGIHGLYLLSLTIYDATLPHLAEGSSSIKISGWAWGWGYAGGLLCLAVMQAGLLLYERYSAWDFLTGSLFFLLFSWLARRSMSRHLAVAAIQPRTHDSRQDVEPFAGDDTVVLHRWQLLIVFMLIVDGIATFLAFFSIYGTKVAHLAESQLTAMMAILQVLAFPLTGIVCSRVDKGLARVLWFCAVIWALTISLIIALPSTASIWCAVVLASATVGSTQAILRAIYSNTVTPRESITGFSIYAIVEKGAAFLGPAMAGWLVVSLGYRYVFAFAGALIVIGCGILAVSCRKKSTPQAVE